MNKPISLFPKLKSKRSALRYKVRPRQISYRKDDETGNATLLNISSAGLLVELATVPVDFDDIVVVSLNGFPPDANGETLTLKTRIVRVEFYEFAGEFVDITDKQARFLSRLLARDIRCRNK